MKLSRILLSAFMMTVLTELLTSCRDELCYNHYPSVDVSLSWEHEWERDYGMNHSAHWEPSLYGFEYESLRPGKPEWVNLIRFTADGTRHETFLQEDKSNIVVDQEEGQSMLLYNGDTEYIVLSDMASVTEARASATPRSRASIKYITEHHPDTRSANPPDILYAAYVAEVPYVGPHETKPLPITMQPLVYTYVVRYEFEYGLENVALARGALAGMAESVYLRDGRTSEEPVIILYDCEITDYGCEVHIGSFGVPGFPDEYYGRSPDDVPERPYTLNLELMLTNGSTVEFNYDVADQLKNQPRGGVITVSGIRIEDEQNSKPITSGGFDVDLSGWGEVDVDLPLPDYD